MDTLTLNPAQSAVASSSTLWAQASKEWVIPAKPRPGRKPKDAAPLKDSQGIDAKGRRVQNRAAQRAFRERKQSQLAELQARVQSYEQGDIERNVALQQISKRLKQENESLKAENADLKAEVALLKEYLKATSSDILRDAKSQEDKEERIKVLKRCRDDNACPSMPSPSNPYSDMLEVSRKKFRSDTLSPMPSSTQVQQEYPQSDIHAPCSPSSASSPGSEVLSGSAYSSYPPNPPAESAPFSHGSELYPLSRHEANKGFDAVVSPPFDSFDCGLCTVTTPCVCREIALQSAMMAPEISGTLVGYAQDFASAQGSTQMIHKIEESDRLATNMGSGIVNIPSYPEVGCSINMSLQSSKSNASVDVSYRDPSTSSRADSNCQYQIRLPSSKPAPIQSSSSQFVALPKKPGRRTASTIWEVAPASVLTCTGDPSNCPACKDDDFGRAFCRALGDCVKSNFAPCASCPNPEACFKTLDSPSDPTSSTIASTENNSESVGDIMGIQITPVSLERQFPTDSSVTNTSLTPSDVSNFHRASQSRKEKPDISEAIPANEAWARLKSHPHIAFADLSMLAEVVARRTKCSGPVAVIDPAPGSATPERSGSPTSTGEDTTVIHTSKLDQSRNCEGKDGDRILLTNLHAHSKGQEQHRSILSSSSLEVEASSQSVVDSCPRSLSSPSPSQDPRVIDRPVLVPQDELRECGRRRIREVDAAGVHDALRMLDAQFGKGS